MNAASRVGEASHRVLTTLGDEDEETRDIQDTLLGLAKAVANTTAALVLRAKSVASTMPSDQQNTVIAAATQCALATSQLVACAKVFVYLPLSLLNLFTDILHFCCVRVV